MPLSVLFLPQPGLHHDGLEDKRDRLRTPRGVCLLKEGHRVQRSWAETSLPCTPICDRVFVILFQVQPPASDAGCSVHSYKSPLCWIPHHSKPLGLPLSCSHTREPTLFRGFILSLCSTSRVASAFLSSDPIHLTLRTRCVALWLPSHFPAQFRLWFNIGRRALQSLVPDGFSLLGAAPLCITLSSTTSPSVIPLCLYISWFCCWVCPSPFYWPCLKKRNPNYCPANLKGLL